MLDLMRLSTTLRSNHVSRFCFDRGLMMAARMNLDSLFFEYTSSKSLDITTNIGCPVGCRYCPQKLVVKRYLASHNSPRFMTKIIFSKCISNVPKEIPLSFSGFSEPFINKDCIDFIELAASEERPLTVFTTLFGTSHEVLDRLRLIHFEDFCVHLPDNESTMSLEPDDDYLNILNDLIKKPPDNCRFVTIGGHLHPRVKQPIKKAGFRVNIQIVNDRAGNINESSSLVNRCYWKGPIRCVSGMSRFVLLPNGETFLCCMDFGLDHCMGNLLNVRYEDLCQSPSFNDIVSAMKRPGPDIICRRCNYARPIGRRNHH